MEIFKAKHPCRQDCPGRTAECKKECERWKAYEAIKREQYKDRMMEYIITDADIIADRRRGKAGCYLGSTRKPKHTGDRSR